jgi:hypothetical protein
MSRNQQVLVPSHHNTLRNPELFSSEANHLYLPNIKGKNNTACVGAAGPVA